MLHQIGSGVQGPVFRATDPASDRLIAVKVFRSDLLPEEAERLSRELQAVSRAGFAHPSAVGLLAAGLEQGTPFLAMEYDGGETLDVVLRRGSSVGTARALTIVSRLASVLDAAWLAGLGHGALHPRDVFLATDGDAVRITGVGVARALEAAGIRARARRPYGSPERQSGDLWDARADVYSLAVLAHDLLTGRRPTGAVGAPDQPQGHTPLGASARRVIARALSAAPADRHDSAGAFASALSAAVGEHLPLFDAIQEPGLEAPGVPGPPAPAAATLEPAAEMPIGRSDEPSAPAPARGRTSLSGVERGRRIVPFDPPAERPRFPWLAVAAVTMAGALLGLVGYRILERPAPPTPAGSEGHVAAASPDLTEVPVTGSASPTADTEVAAERPQRSAAPRQTERPAPVRASAGRLVVHSSPTGALVTVDGQLVGETPVTMTDVALGRHHVLVARPGHVPDSQQVLLTESRPSRTLDVSLSPGVDGARPAGTGALTVDSRPGGARVYLDGRLVGTTPLRLGALRSGLHSIRLDLKGYRTLTTDVTVAAGPAGRLAVTLERTGLAPGRQP